MESLILAQDKRWRRALGMQVERASRTSVLAASGERVSNAYVTYPEVGNNSAKAELIPHMVAGGSPVDKSLRALSEGRAAD